MPHSPERCSQQLKPPRHNDPEGWRRGVPRAAHYLPADDQPAGRRQEQLTPRPGSRTGPPPTGRRRHSLEAVALDQWPFVAGAVSIGATVRRYWPGDVPNSRLKALAKANSDA